MLKNFLTIGTLALGICAFAPAALAASCGDDIAMTQAALDKEKDNLTGASKKVNGMFRKAKRFRDSGKRKGCVKVAKKTRKVITKASACNRHGQKA